MRLPEIAVRRPVTTIMVFAAIALLGAVAFFKLNLDMLPNIEPPAAIVITPYPGASATDVESEVTKYLEDQLSTAPNLDRLESVSKDNLSIISCLFDWGTDIDVAVNDMREKIDLAKPDITLQAEDSFIFKFSSAMVPVLVVTVTGRESSPDLYRIVDKQLADPLKRIPGVGAILYEGGVERQINIHFDRQALEAHNISVQQIRNVLSAENLTLPAGNVKVGERELQIRVSGRFSNTYEIANTVIGRHGDVLIHLRDVAAVTDGHEEPTQWAWGNGVPGMVMIIQKQSGANTINVIKAVKKRLEALRGEVPADIEVHTILDTSDQIYAMIRSLSKAAIGGGFLVIVVCFFFLRRFRPSLVVTLAIPLSMIAAFIGLFLMDYTINVISLMSLAIAVGMVVDDAIVVLENVVRHVDQGQDTKHASVFGASEVGMAVTTSALSLVCVFVPLLLVKGIAGVIFNQLAFVIIVMILMSNFVALTLTPMACSRLLRERGARKSYRILAWSERVFRRVEDGYAGILQWGLDHRKKAFLVLALMFMGSLTLIPLVGVEFLPEVDSSEIEVVAELPEGTRGEVTAGITEKILDIFQEVPELRASYGLAGQSKKGLLSALGFTEGPNIGRVGARLAPKEKRQRSTKEIAAAIRPQVASIAGVEKLSLQAISAIQKVFFGGGRPISIEVLGHDLQTTDSVAEEIRHIVETTPGVVDVVATRKKPRPEICVRLDRDKAASMGVTVASVADTLRTSYFGFDGSKFRDGGDDFDIELRLKEQQRRSIAQIGDTALLLPSGQTVKLRNVATVEETSGPVEIERKNRVRVTRVQAGIQGRVLGDVVNDIRSRLASLDLPPGISVAWGGDVEEQRKAFRDLALMLLLAIALVYMVMAGQFEDFVDPFIIMFSVPFAFVGVIWAFALTGTPLNLMSFIGVVMLMGIVVKNAIVLVDYTRQLRNGGMVLREAVVAGGKTRLRPVLMTSLTTIFGMAPLALSRGEGSEVWNAMGITVIGGLLMSGIVTLLLVPLVYSVVHQHRLRNSAGSTHQAGG